VTSESSWTSPHQVLPVEGQWSELDAGGACSPCVLESDDGTAMLWYAGRDDATQRILAARRLPDGSWTRSGAVVDAAAAGHGDGQIVGSPSVIPIDSGFVMAYVVSGRSSSRVHLAASPDGLQWKPQGEIRPRGEPDDVVANDPCLVVGNQWWLFYGASDIHRRARVDAAVSPNGCSWTWVGSVLAPHSGEVAVLEPSVLVAYGAYHMFFVSDDGHRSEIQLATSADGLQWERRGTTLKGPGEAGNGVRTPCVVRAGGALRLWYSAPDSSSADSTVRLWAVEAPRSSL
jgi:predicted GH43/DUF377 family glycosyl hydrolase